MGRRERRHPGNLVIHRSGLKPPTSGCGFREVLKAVQEGLAETIQRDFTETARLSEGRGLKRFSDPYEIERKISYKYL